MNKNQKQNKVYLTPSPDSIGFSPASQQTIADTIKFSSEIGFKTVILGRRINVPFNPLVYYGRIFRQLKNAKILLATYPYICRPTKEYLLRNFESRLIKMVTKGKFSILYIIDLPIEQQAGNPKPKTDKKAYEVEECILKSFDILLVFNENMKNNIQEKYDIDDEKFIKFEILDYGVDYVPQKEKNIGRTIKIIYSGSLKISQSKWIKRLPFSKDIIYEFSGVDGEWISKLQKENIVYRGFVPKNHFFDFLSKYDFGIMYKDFKEINYYEFTSTSKFSAYMISGLPVLCTSKFSYISHLVRKYKVGLVFESFNDIPKLIDGLDEEGYKNLRINCIKLGGKIKNGYFFKKVVNKAIKGVYI